jgi:hypothetical protein
MKLKHFALLFSVVGVTCVSAAAPAMAAGRTALSSTPGAAASSSSSAAFALQPFTFVGAMGDCGPGYPAGHNIVTSQWDSSTGNPAPSILLQKNGPTADCSAAGVDIVSPLEGQPVSQLTELNFDYKTGGHCGAGAPRFNIQTENGLGFLGCAGGTQTNLGNGWTHVEFNAAQIQAAVVAGGGGTTLQDLYIIFDEGTDTPPGGTVGTPGTVHIDNISLNNQVVGSPTSPLTKDECKDGGWQNPNFNPSFKNQGDCVSFVATHGKNTPSMHKH